MTLAIACAFVGRDIDDPPSVQEQLERGDVVVGLKDVGHTKYVTAKVLINAPPDRVWPIIVNPFEFQGKISPRMKTVEVYGGSKKPICFKSDNRRGVDTSFYVYSRVFI